MLVERAARRKVEDAEEIIARQWRRLGTVVGSSAKALHVQGGCPNRWDQGDTQQYDPGAGNGTRMNAG